MPLQDKKSEECHQSYEKKYKVKYKLKVTYMEV